MLLYDGIYDIDSVKMTIFQPRKDHVSSSIISKDDLYSWAVDVLHPIISKDDLYSWAVDVLHPIAEIAAKGEGDFKAGDHCRFCKIKAACRKRAEYNLELAKYDFKPADELDEIEIAAILERADGFAAWLADLKDYALSQALKGYKYEGFKLVAGRSVRKYKDEAKSRRLCGMAGGSERLCA